MLLGAQFVLIQFDENNDYSWFRIEEYAGEKMSSLLVNSYTPLGVGEGKIEYKKME